MKQTCPVLRSLASIAIAIASVALAVPASADEPAPDAAPPADPAAPTVAPAPPSPADAPEAIPEGDAEHGKHKHKHGKHADEAPPDTADTADAAASDDHAKHGKHGNKAKKPKKLQAGGRVFVRSAFQHVEGDEHAALQDTVQSARAGAKYRAHELRAELEVELAGRARIKDAFVQLRLLDAGARIDVRAGQFKMPFSAIERTSIWSLPVADRGLLHAVLAKRLQVAGRAVGAMLVIEFPDACHLAIEAGAFQGRDDADVLLEGTASDGLGQDGVVRVSIKPVHGVELGVAGSTRAGRLLELPVEIRRAYAGEVDAHLDVGAGPGRLRLWAEGSLGTSWLVGGTDPNHHRAQFVEGRAIAGYRIGGPRRRDRAFELYGLAGVLDPDARFTGDRLLELSGGASYGTQLWRLQLEGEVWRVGDAAPNGIVELTVPPTDSKVILLQLGARI